MGKPEKRRYYGGGASRKLAKELSAEQAKLVEAQTNLKQLIGTINERLNVLKVEELQLRSMVAQTKLTQPESKFDPSTSTEFFDFETSTEIINKQDLNLDITTECIFKQFQEEDDDD